MLLACVLGCMCRPDHDVCLSPTRLPPTAGGPEGPPRPPGAWESVLRGLHGVMGVFGRITMLVDENTYAVNFFIQALLQLLDRSAPVSPGLRKMLEEAVASSHSSSAASGGAAWTIDTVAALLNCCAY
jgi:hypothetical protein